jgi:hypothetical protein
LGALLVTVASFPGYFLVLDNFLGDGVPFFTGVTLPLPFGILSATILTEKEVFIFDIIFFVLNYSCCHIYQTSCLLLDYRFPLIEMLVGIYWPLFNIAHFLVH